MEPVSEERRQRLLALEGFLILGRPKGGNSYQGFVENSFSMGWSPNYVNFWWSGEATSNFGTKHKIDGRADAEHYLAEERRLRPDWDIEIFDAKDENLPVVLDWDGWVDAHAYNPNTLSGVSDKFRARNFRFEMKE